MSDRYVFAKVCDCEFCRNEHAIPAPSPEDWQAIVDAVEQYDTDEEIAREDATSWLITVTLAAVRNMREAER